MARARSYKRGYTNYNYSSSAYAYEPAYKPYYNDEEERAAQERARREKAAAEVDKRRATAHKFKLTAAILAVFAGCFIMMASYAAVTQQRIKNNQLSNELVALKGENTILQSEITDSVDLEYIKKEAVERLGMTEPQPYQIVYIDVPKQSYNVQYGSTEDTDEDKFTFKALLNLFGK